ncbi:hypothetical protein [Marinicellulosiphila megalodicopiae]|uniref:hypothetical protein n=1 Tax=Marinicellulosiphila megalodicopiae TaxID=2724896 RepID=UPI003BB09570
MNIKNLLAGSILIGSQLVLSGCKETPVKDNTPTQAEKQEAALVQAKSFTANMQSDMAAIVDVEDEVMSFFEGVEQDAENINTLALEAHFKAIAQATILTAQYLEPSVIEIYDDSGEFESVALDFSQIPLTASIESYNTGDLESLLSYDYEEVCEYFSSYINGDVYDDEGNLVSVGRIEYYNENYIDSIDGNYVTSTDSIFDPQSGEYYTSYETCYEQPLYPVSEDGFANAFTGDFVFDPQTNILTVTNATTSVTTDDGVDSVTADVMFSYEVKLPSFDQDGKFTVALTNFQSSDNYNNSLTIDNLYFNLEAGVGFSNYELTFYEDTIEAEGERLLNSLTAFSVGLDAIELDLNGLKIYGSGSLSMSGIEIDTEILNTKVGAFELNISGGIENSSGAKVEVNAALSIYETYSDGASVRNTVMVNLHLDAMLYKANNTTPEISAIFDFALTSNLTDSASDIDSDMCGIETYNEETDEYDYTACDYEFISQYIESIQIQADYQLIIGQNVYEFGGYLDLNLVNESADFTLTQVKGGSTTQLVLYQNADADFDVEKLEIGVIKTNSIEVGTIYLNMDTSNIEVDFIDGTTDTMFDANEFLEMM